MRERLEPTFGEHIQNEIQKKPAKNTIKLINTSFYLEEKDRAIPFYVRRTNFLRDDANKKFTARRTLNVPDYDLEKKQEQDKFK